MVPETVHSLSEISLWKLETFGRMRRLHEYVVLEEKRLSHFNVLLVSLVVA